MTRGLVRGCGPDRDAPLAAVVHAWADVATVANAAMYAWRRANVAELNRRVGLPGPPSVA